MKAEYPKWLYRGEESKLVKSEEERKALGLGWSESPSSAPEVPAAPKKKPAK